MIRIYIDRSQDRQVEGFKVVGHSGYAQEGEDIVCAAVSAIVQTAAMGIGDVADIDMQYYQDKGYVSCLLPDGLSPRKKRDAHMILETMIVGLKSIELQYSSFVCIKESEVN